MADCAIYSRPSSIVFPPYRVLRLIKPCPYVDESRLGMVFHGLLNSHYECRKLNRYEKRISDLENKTVLIIFQTELCTFEAQALLSMARHCSAT